MSKRLQIEGLTIGYQNPIVSEINADFDSAEIAIVLGSNGSGKSTLLKTITGLIPSLAGNVYLNGKSIDALSKKDRSTTISFALNTIVSVNITAGEFLSFSNLFQALSQIELHEIYERFQINHLLDKPLNSISDGQRQMVSVARCIVQNTPIIYLDEPTAFLDYQNIQKVLSIVQYYAQNGKTFLINTHDRVWIEEIANKKIYGIREGQFVNVSDRPNWDDLKHEFA